MKKTGVLDVAWYLTLKSKKPFAYSTVATSDLIAVLAEMYEGDTQKIYDNINYDEDAKAIMKTYLDNGVERIRVQ